MIKVTANPKTARLMADHVDLDVSGLLSGDMVLDEAGDALIEMVIRLPTVGTLQPRPSATASSSSRSCTVREATEPLPCHGIATVSPLGRDYLRVGREGIFTTGRANMIRTAAELEQLATRC